jgi:hypothetical protein
MTVEQGRLVRESGRRGRRSQSEDGRHLPSLAPGETSDLPLRSRLKRPGSYRLRPPTDGARP